MTTPGIGQTTSLRELKKARTRAAIQREAMRLFRERGYEATTIEQIAQAAEVAHTTVFRYFPTKEDLVMSDDHDPLLYAALRDAPAHLSPLQALRTALQVTLAGLSADDLATGRERAVLILSVPALRGAMFDNFVTTMRTVARIIAERTGRDPEDTAVRTVTAATFGVFLDLMLRWAQDPQLDLPAAVDDALAALQIGLMDAAKPNP
jgi:AcrR family transcriptional regulator